VREKEREKELNTWEKSVGKWDMNPLAKQMHQNRRKK